MKRISQLAFALSILSAGSSLAADRAEQSFYLHPQDTVVFYGDSITEQRLYTLITELYTVTRYPNLDVKFVHSGWGGDRVTGGGGGQIDKRLERDVFAYNPTVVTIMLGMNDGKYEKHTAADDDVFRDGFKHIVDSLREHLPDVRITAIEPSPFDDVTRPYTLRPGGYNAVLVKYSQWIRQYAETNHLTDANLNTSVVQMLRRANSTDHDKASKIIPDRIHPGIAGHLVMAEQLLKAWGARPIVSSVAIDAAAGKVTQSEFTEVSDLHNGDSLVWTEKDEALPLPLPQLSAGDRAGLIALAIGSSDITNALNRQPLQVTGLKAGRYKLTIDGDTVGTWSDAELKKGVNLAAVPTPMGKQAMQVRDLTARHIDIHQFRWRTLQVPMADSDVDHLDEAMRDLDDIERQVVAKQRSAAQPRPHVFQLAPAA